MRLSNAIFGRAVLTAVLGCAGTAGAGDLYYQEVHTADGIYVFQDQARYERWSASGEIGEAITRPGFGPNGEPVVFDSAQAVEAWTERHHAVPQPQAEHGPSAVQLSWKDGKTTLETDSVEIQLSNRVQLRFTQDQPADDADTGFFELRRAKTKITGWLYSKSLAYGVQLNWADTANPLEDAYVDWAVSGSALRVTLGQYKVPFGRQELTSSGSQQFVDRSIVSKAFARGRDVGLQLGGRAAGGRLEWRAGVFNGNGRTASRDARDRFQLDARVQLAPAGDPKYSESDFESKGHPLYAIAVGVQRRDVDDAGTGRKRAQNLVGVDGTFKHRGVSLFAEGFFGTTEALAGDDPSAAVDTNGFHAQAGYLFAARTWELALRYARLDPSRSRSGDERTEVGGALSYYYRKHGVKAQADVRRIENGGSDTGDIQLRLQTQFVF